MYRIIASLVRGAKRRQVSAYLEKDGKLYYIDTWFAPREQNLRERSPKDLERSLTSPSRFPWTRHEPPLEAENLRDWLDVVEQATQQAVPCSL